ncbi:MAG: hypothetical protein K2Q12_07640, partial [Rickettsiales bacterium]|nr:hypothetical protein [Rickettsiales bacterium]
DAKKAGEIFDLVDKFAGYGFNKAHAAAYALIGYQTAYLKANYPVEFIAASMTYDLHNTDKLAIFCEDARKAGIAVLPPDINHSEATFSVETNEKGVLCLRYALAALKNVGEQAMQAIVAERQVGGMFLDVFDFARRVPPGVMNRRQLEQMIKAGTFDALEPNRKRLFDSIELLIGYCHAMAEEKNSNQISLFGDAVEAQPLPALPVGNDWAPLERLDHEFGAVGFYLSTHPLEGYANVLRRMKVVSYTALPEKLGSQYSPISMAGIVTGIKIKASDKGRFAFVQISDRTAAYEASIFDETILDTHRTLLEAGKMVYLSCDAKMEEAGPRIIITQVKLLDEMAAQSSCEQLDIVMDDVEQNVVVRLQQLFGAPQSKGCRIKLRVAVSAARLAEIQLSGLYRVSPEALLEIQTLQGVRSVAEA